MNTMCKAQKYIVSLEITTATSHTEKIKTIQPMESSNQRKHMEIV